MAGRKKSDRVTIRTVAEDAGVSVAAVSKVLRDAYGVSEQLRGKVRESIDRLGYRPHAAARGMRGQTFTLGVLLSDIRNPFFADIMIGVNAALERTQYQFLIGTSQSAISIEMALVDSMIDRQMDGLILVAPRMSDADVERIAESVPTVLIGHHNQAATQFDTVNGNDQLGAELVVKHLAGNGYKTIAYLGLNIEGPESSLVTTQRRLGYRRMMAEVGLAKSITMLEATQSAREVQLAAKHLMTARNRPDAIFCWTDFVALEVLSVARELRLDVPKDIAIVGYDNTVYCDLAQNALTSVDQSGELLGLQAARLLIERIKGRETAEHFVITPRLVARESSAKRG